MGHSSNELGQGRVTNGVDYVSCLQPSEGLSNFLVFMYMFVCMYKHVYRHTCACMCIHVEARGLLLQLQFFEARDSHWTCRLASSCLPSAGVAATHPVPEILFYLHVFWGASLGLYAQHAHIDG